MVQVFSGPVYDGHLMADETSIDVLPGITEPIPESGSAQTEPTDDKGPYIQFRDVSKAFGEKHVLSHVSFVVNTGETVCILGRSGVGKSVALQHILGFLKPDSGRVMV